MTVKTITNLKTDVGTSLADNTSRGISPEDIRESVVDSIDTLHSNTGWAQYIDGTYTSGSPLAVNNARVQLTNDAGTAITSQLPSGVTNFWAGNEITPENDGDYYNVRVDFTAEMNSANGFAVLELDIGGTPGVIVERGITFPKGTGVATKFSLGFPVFTGSTFLANGGQLFLNTTGGSDNMDVYDIAIFIGRAHKGV